MTEHKTIVLYHANCPDGFGGAYAAWRKFGDDAKYIPVKPGSDAPENLIGAHVYLIDFCYPQEIMDNIVNETASLTVLDHHEGIRAVVESMPEFVFDANRSGATIAWSYFHPDVPTPTLLKHIEDDDLFRFKLPETRAIVRYLSARPLSFEGFDSFICEFDDLTTHPTLLTRLENYSEYFDILVEKAVTQAKLVQFEGRECYFANAHPFITMRSAVGNALVLEKPPLALVASAHPEGFGVSLRSDGSVNVAEIAQKYGGNGHPTSAGFTITWGEQLPWTLITSQK